eukprot:TRINITY_DN7383_c1_g2_i2.p1 TRINITY_DN7383_c1_g2~~TRINITY_DN7383_c1_g2_i2.p1  ORF type:complete len:280 (+),score=36.19 TRINITY_DN7383_c1_g2_i2:61-840(+)
MADSGAGAVVLCFAGQSGSGKTTLARRLAFHCGGVTPRTISYHQICLNDERRDLWGEPLWVRVFQPPVSEVRLGRTIKPRVYCFRSPPPPPPPPPVKPTVKFTPPVIKKDEEVKEDEKPPEQQEITNVGVKNQEGDANAIEAPIDAPGTGVVEAPAQEIFRYVEQMPEPPFDIPSFLQKNLNYPQAAKENNIEGTVTVQFVVGEDGSVSDAKVVGKKIGAGCEEEAVRVVSSFPKWKPGKQNGRPVRVYYTQRITFRLE